MSQDTTHRGQGLFLLGNVYFKRLLVNLRPSERNVRPQQSQGGAEATKGHHRKAGHLATVPLPSSEYGADAFFTETVDR